MPAEHRGLPWDWRSEDSEVGDELVERDVLGVEREGHVPVRNNLRRDAPFRLAPQVTVLQGFCIGGDTVFSTESGDSGESGESIWGTTNSH